MILYSTVVTLICVFLWLRLRKIRKVLTIDMVRVYRNLEDIVQLAVKDYDNGELSPIQYRFIVLICKSFVISPGSYSKIMDKSVNNFWRTYKLTPDFIIEPEYVYNLLKEYSLYVSRRKTSRNVTGESV